MKKSVIGILAHVDAGKTTLTESMLYHSGSIRRIGRVDHKDAFLDYDIQERNRGITIFSKEARFTYKDTSFVLLDTPGHVDFSAEMERTLQVLDYAIILINAMDSVQSHSETIWNLLKTYEVPAFIFVNKMDAAHFSKEELMNDIENKLSSNCIDFNSEDKDEKIAMCDESVLEAYAESGSISETQIQTLIYERKCYPVYFGSALKDRNITDFMEGLNTYIINKKYHSEFGARVYKVDKDKQGNRLTHMKVTGGTLKVKSMLEDEKIDQIRLYNGEKFELSNEVEAGEIVALKGIKKLVSGEGIGYEREHTLPILKPYMKYRILYNDDTDSIKMLEYLNELKDEDPTLVIQYLSNKDEIYVQLMGEIQIEILKNILKERFNVDVSFDQGDVVYKESIVNTVEGIGHFEPLRHYAEVHVLLEPLKEGSGLQFEINCKEDVLAKNWQRLIYTHFMEKEHVGVLTGSPITDMRITLIGGKAHLKHTVGGDFRQATYRAIRHGLKCAESILLEPYFHYRLLIPSESLSKAIYDIEQMEATFTMEDKGEFIELSGEAPVRKMQNYAQDVMNYSKGRGKLYCSISGYKKVKDQDRIVTSIGYDSELDVHNPTGSVFCASGAGYYVPYYEVKDMCHLGTIYHPNKVIKETSSVHTNKYRVDDDEVKRVFESIYGKSKPKNRDVQKKREKKVDFKVQKHKPLCMLVDGYNVIYSDEMLSELASHDLNAARDKLIDILSSYQGYRKCLLILVFDAYKVESGTGSEYFNGSIHIVYTKQAQTADSYIEKASHDLASDYTITVVTSDGMEQIIIIGQGAYRMSSRELMNQVDSYTKRRMENQKKEYHARPHLLEKIKEYEDDKDD